MNNNDKMKIATLINKWDPIRLFEAGCPEDEYEAEISELQNSILKEDSEEIIAKKIYTIFKKQFGETFNNPIDDCEKIAKQIKEHFE